MRLPKVTVNTSTTTSSPSASAPSRGAMARDPKKSTNKPADKKKDDKKKEPTVFQKEKERLLQMDPNDPTFSQQVDKFREIARKRNVKENVINAFIVKAQKKKPMLPQTPTQIAQKPGDLGGKAYEDLVNQFLKFDPSKMQQQYEAGFGAEMERARQNVLSQFERRNAEEFARERQATEQSIVERGLDPNSPAAQGLMRSLNDRQDRARQEAQSAAEQAAYAVNQQGYEQAYRAGMMPYEQFQALSAPYMAYITGQYGQQGAQQQFEFDIKKLQEAARLQKQSGGGGGGGGGSSADNRQLAEYIMRTIYGQQQGQQPQQPSTGQSFATGVAGGSTLAIANR